MTRATALYRHYDASGELLYVGITDSLSGRDKQHQATSVWHAKAHETKTQWCLSREHAEALERVAIRFERPLHNVLHVASDATSASGMTICDLFSCWPNRKDLADEIGASLAAVHKWAAAERIPTNWQAHVLKAARLKGIPITPEWMVDVHAKTRAPVPAEGDSAA